MRDTLQSRNRGTGRGRRRLKDTNSESRDRIPLFPQDCGGDAGKEEREDGEESLDDVAGRLGLQQEAVEGGPGGAEVGDGSGRHALVLELLRHGAEDDAEVLVVGARGVAEPGEDRVAEVAVVGRVVEVAREAVLHFNAFHGET